MELKELRKIVELMNEHGLTYFDMSKDGFHLKLKKGQDLESLKSLMSALPMGYAAAPAPMQTPAPAASPVQAAAPTESGPASDGEPITSPMVGTFYRKPSPDAENFISVGDTISDGQTLCIIEAMKVMNEIKAERSGTITAILVDDGTPVQFGDTLFTIK
ncbi:acetyl-CoA carboxylase biotin carboxyl carrier protein [Haloferula sargassicola]|uniref:Biotin carboxyl carrier protein of acetyl-CoA carboxylase n=1 Tax=Haloferula sargassicola TaxID=490096 RepID=A0ABP9UWL9_9BACT